MQEENDSTTSQLRHLRSELKQIQTDKSDVDDRLIRVSEREKEDEIKIATLHKDVVRLEEVVEELTSKNKRLGITSETTETDLRETRATLKNYREKV